MARAKAVRGIRPGRPLHENARRVIETRLDEFLGWQRALDDPSLVSELHDMRIAAKRLRYALEIFDLCVHHPKPLLRELTALQEDLGTIHDLDVFAQVIRHHLQALEAADEEACIQVMSDSDSTDFEKGRDVRRVLVGAARDPRHVGYAALLGRTIAERRARYARFADQYTKERLEAFAESVHIALRDARPDEGRDGPGVAQGTDEDYDQIQA